MTIFHDLGESQKYFTNCPKKIKNFLTDARVFNIEKENKSLLFWERLGGDRKGVRLAIKDKKPQYPSGSD